MAKRRLIKKISEVSDEELNQDITYNEPEIKSEGSGINNQLIEEQEQEIKRLRELIDEYRMQETEFEQNKEENFRLSQQNKQLVHKIENNQDQVEILQQRNDELAAQLTVKETEIVELSELNKVSTSSEDDVEQLKLEIVGLKQENSKNQEQIAYLETALIEKEKELATNIQEKEAEIKQLETELATRGTIGEKQEALETVKMELEALNEKLQTTNKENQELTEKLAGLQEQMRQMQVENQELKEKEEVVASGDASIDSSRLHELKKELETIMKEKSELETNFGRIQGLNDKYSIQKDVFESELSDLRDSYKAKEQELEVLKSELESMRSLSATGEVKGDQLVELLQAKQQINDLLLKNQSLQEEAFKSQQEIGEVMVSAKKEANRIISEAKVEAKHMINSAELEMLNIGNRAKNISNEVEESKNEIMGIYHELEERLSKIARLDRPGK